MKNYDITYNTIYEIVGTEITKHHGVIKRVKCCGRLTRVYLKEEKQHCSRCNYEYDFNGTNIGYFGSGKNEEQYSSDKRVWKPEVSPDATNVMIETYDPKVHGKVRFRSGSE